MRFLRSVLLLIVVFTVSCSPRSILDIIREEEDFSSFRSFLFRYELGVLLEGTLTVFVPTNAAFANYRGVLDKKVLLNHFVNWTLPLDTLDSRTRIITQDNYPCLWVSRGRDFLYVNNAKIDLDRSKYTLTVESGDKKSIQVTTFTLFFF